MERSDRVVRSGDPSPGEWRRAGRLAGGGIPRRIVGALSVVLVAPVAALLLQLRSLHAMDSSLEAMLAQEHLAAVALALGESLRSAFASADRLRRGEEQALAPYQRSHARSLDLLGDIERGLDVPEGRLLLDRVHEAVRQLDGSIRPEAPGAVRSGPGPDPATWPAPPVLADVDRDVDGLLKLAQRSISGCRAELDEVRSRASAYAVVLGVALPLLVAGAAAYLWRSIARPLARLSEGAARLARGELDERIAVERPDELGRLAMEFNAMTAALKHHQARLVETEMLAGIGRVAAGVAHEINNPLQVMIGYLSLHRDHGDRRLAEHLALVEQEAQHCRRIVGDLIALARPQEPSEPVDLRALCDDVLEHLRGSTCRRGPRMSVEGTGFAAASASRIRQVLLNLAKNAAEAAGAEGWVAVRIAPQAGCVSVSVADSGSGVSQEAAGSLFQPFFTTKAAGTGLGLAVSRSIARSFGGDVELAKGDGAGALFRLRLPVAQGRA